ncbi:MAG: hypothetical protein QOF86_4602 [Baekduia sp.]|jgi:predicted dithiol-disulfide oxidoreductase (DUF899 family)|nr:hypothetical protein [Baekduia sp.]
MSNHQVGTREEWLAARRTLLAREKELTRRSDELARERQALPWVPVETEYVFATDAGPRTLAELFDGRSQLLVYHLMFGPDDEAACPGCTYYSDHLDGSLEHLAAHDVTLLAASRAPLSKLQAYRRRMGWRFPWVSSHGTAFNLDFTLFTEEERRAGRGYNFGTPGALGIDLHDTEVMAFSAFALGEDGTVFHTYSAYDRGTDVLNPTWQLLDRAPLGRNATATSDGPPAGWPQRRDEYDPAPELSLAAG